METLEHLNARLAITPVSYHSTSGCEQIRLLVVKTKEKYSMSTDFTFEICIAHNGTRTVSGTVDIDLLRTIMTSDAYQIALSAIRERYADETNVHKQSIDQCYGSLNLCLSRIGRTLNIGYETTTVKELVELIGPLGIRFVPKCST